ncbi:DsbE family thiol:disulfide interchange protein [Aquitalea aquatica]|uniref:DsbE family thiol:disulfide interchange protein n=1 Tax=Aquitalea aquatica TaxID=3044273 RepID=A0A838Y8F7_9NEIS|nr:DsbE family thiol:disulfide interchange protein [Aquitalea magnusonii]MBA4710138.1 DsbE family thiol:disulfide interchange protein [Aquitalea magnusonii]
MKPKHGKSWLLVLPLLGFLGLLWVFLHGLQRDPHALPSSWIGRPAPLFVLPRLDAPAQTFSPAMLRGRVWLLNVWASWCESCHTEHPTLMQLAQHDGLAIVGLNQQDVPDAARAWLAKAGNPYLWSVMDRDARVSIDYGVYGVPETFVIDQAGIVRYRHLGSISPQDARDILLPLIRKLQA